jgi:hypothetical protein
MRKLGLTAGLIAGAILLAASIHGHAAGDGKAEIIQIEKQALAAATADELVEFYDQSDIITYDYIPPLQYVGAKAVHADVDKFFSKTRDLKGDFVDLKVELTARWAWRTVFSTSLGRAQTAQRMKQPFA